MIRRRSRRSSPVTTLRRAGVAIGVLSLLLPSTAAAHGLSGPRSLPLPEWLFAWAAAIVLVVSFVALSVLWPRPRLAALAVGRSVAVPAAVRVGGRVLLGALGVAIWAVVVWAGLTGTSNVQANIAPTMVYVGFWVGIPVLSLFVGDLWRALSPWRAIAEGAAWLGERIAGPGNLPRPMPFPERVGLFPAAAVLLCFGWLELAAPDRDDPALLAVLALVYCAAMLIGTSLYGTRFLDHADGFGQYFRFAGSLAPLRWHEGRLHVRWPGTGLVEVQPERGLAAVVLVLIGTTTFDGLSGGELWNNEGAVGPWLEDLFVGVGLSINAAATVAKTVGLAAVIAIISGFVWVGILGIHRVDPTRYTPSQLLGRFAPTLAPIAIGYAVAHYCSLLAQGGQSLAFLISDPRGDGSNWFGTADWGIDYGLLTGDSAWYVQVAALVLGHVAGLVAAHDLALRTFRGPRAAARSQYWMLAVMVGFTSLGLWLLS